MKKISFVFLLLACAHTPPKPFVRTTPDVFPAGTYQHDIDISVTTPQGKKDFSFSGVVNKSADKLVIVGLTYGMTAFKVIDDLHGNVKKEFQIKEFEKLGPHFDEYYEPLKQIMLVQNPVTEKFEIQTTTEKIVVHLEKYDENQIPKEIELSGDHFTLKVKVTGYKLKETP